MKTTTMKRGALDNVYANLKQLMSLPGAKFSYAVVMNLKKIEAELVKNYDYKAKLAKKHNTPDSDTYEAKRVELANKFCKKDEEGNPIVSNNMYIPNDKVEWDAEYAKLAEKYPDTVKALENRVREEGEYLNGDVEIEIYKVKEEDMSPYINGQQRIQIEFMIEEVDVKSHLKSVN